MKNVYIVEAKRTPIGSFLGSLKDYTAADLMAVLIADLKQTQPELFDLVDEVIVGHVLSANQGQGVSRQAALRAGLPESVCAYSVNMVCGSGLKAIANAWMSILSGQAHVVLAGGVEVMSQTPYYMPARIRNGAKMGSFSSVDGLLQDGLLDGFDHQHMGITAERVSQLYGIDRLSQDEFALESQRRANQALEDHQFQDEIVAVPLKESKTETMFDQDEYPRKNSTLERLSKLRSSFQDSGTVTAGNSSGINDGASLVSVVSEDSVKKYHLTPMVRIVGYTQAGVDPAIMGIAPVPAIIALLEKYHLSLDDIGLFELNEAFSAQSLAVIQELAKNFHTDKKKLMDRININGGAIALGHPIGASGNRIVVSLTHAMKKHNVRYGIASLCIGGGMAIAMLLENAEG